MKIHIFPSKYHQNGVFSMAMLVYRRVLLFWMVPSLKRTSRTAIAANQWLEDDSCPIFWGQKTNSMFRGFFWVRFREGNFHNPKKVLLLIGTPYLSALNLDLFKV